MARKLFHPELKALIVAVAAALAAQSALACDNTKQNCSSAGDTLTFNGFYYSGTQTNYGGTDTVKLTDTASSPNGQWIGPSWDPTHATVYSGAFKMVDTTADFTLKSDYSKFSQTIKAGHSFMAWCIDVFDDLQTPAKYTLIDTKTASQSTLTSISEFTMTPTKVLELERLASNDLGLATSQKTAALRAQYSSAFQLAVWEIMAENSSTLDLTKGNFQASNDADGAIVLADKWLANLGNAVPKEELYVWKSGNCPQSQDLAVFVPVIPEPETYAMLLAGLGVMGAVARRKRKAT